MMPLRKFGSGLFVIVAAMLLFACGGGNGSPPPPPPPPPAPLTITTTSLPAAYEGKPYSQALQATGGSPPYTWSLGPGPALPSGLSLSTAGVISGTSTWTGQSSYFDEYITVTDAAYHSATATIRLTLIGTLRITTTSLWPGNVAVPLSQYVTINGGKWPYTFSLAQGTLPAGVSLSSTGLISGTPTAYGDFDVTVAVKDSDVSPQSATATFKLTITNNVVITNPNALPATVVNKPVSATFAAAGGTPPYTWSLAPGWTMPAGMGLDSSTGVFSGTPTSTGYYSLRIQATDSSQLAQTGWKDFYFLVNPPLAFNTASPLPDGVQSRWYGNGISGIGGLTPYTFQITSGSLPAGLTSTNMSSWINISGTPTTVGSSTFDVQVTDSESPPVSVTKTYSIRINSLLTAQFPTSAQVGLVGQPFSYQFTASGGLAPLTWFYLYGPSSLTMDATSGLLSGTPTTAFDGSFLAQVSDSSVPPQNVSGWVRLHVPDILRISTSSLPPVATNAPLTFLLKLTGGTGPFTWSVSPGALPAGLALDSSGTIKGTPTAAGSSTFTVAVSDPGPPAQSATRDLTLATTAAPGRNDTIATAVPLSNGRYSASISPLADPPDGTPAPDVDVYKLTADPGAAVTVEIFAQRLTPSSPLDSVIEFVDENGNRLQTCDTYNGPGAAYNFPCLNDDLGSGTVDSRLYFQAPASASGPVTFYVRVLDWRGDARPDFAYQISISGAT